MAAAGVSTLPWGATAPAEEADEVYDEYSDEEPSDGESLRSDGAGSADGADDDDARASSGGEELPDDEEHLQLLRAPILNICTALGGYEHVDNGHGKLELVYRLGDDCLGCLRDLRRLWRQDDTDPTRAIARVFAALGVLQNDLIPILLHCAGTDERGSKIALACTELITALTWPIDFYAEVRDVVTRDEDEDRISRLSELQAAQVEYKASVLRVRAKEARLAGRSVLSCVVRHVLLPSLARPRADRTERDVGVIGMCLHLFRNLLAIKDPVVRTRSSTDVLANATLQSALVAQLDESHALDTLRMLASNADAKEYEAWVPVVADCLYHIYVGADAQRLAAPAAPDDATERSRTGEASAATTRALLASLHAEDRDRRQHVQRLASARHSRFGTTIQFAAQDGSLRVARQPAALVRPVAQLEEAIADKARRKIHRRKAASERGGGTYLRQRFTPAAHALVQRWGDCLVQDGAFALLLQAYLRDIHAERERVGDLDLARCKAMQLARFFLEYFLARRSRAASGEKAGGGAGGGETAWPFSLVAAWLEPWAFRLARSRAEMAREGRDWFEFVTSVQLWTALLRLLDALARGSPEERVAADELQETLYYNGELLDTSLQVMHAYSAQSLATLEAVLEFAYTMPRQLERHAQQHEYMFVRQRRRAGAGGDEPDGGSGERRERQFRFQTFQRAMATSRLAHACMQMLVRWNEATHPPTMLVRLAHVMHRIAVKADRVALFFPARTRSVLSRVLSGASLEALRNCDQGAAANLERLGAHVQRYFRKLEAPAQEAFDADRRPERAPRPPKMPAEICVRPGFEHSEQIGVAIALLAELHKLQAVAWVKFALELAAAERKALLAGDEELDAMQPPPEVAARFTDHVLRYDDRGELQEDATRLPALKLLCRLVGLECDTGDPEAWRWLVPARLAPGALERDARVMDQYLAQPIFLGDRRAEDCVQRVRPARAPAGDTREERRKRKRSAAERGRRKRRPRVPQWLENEFIEDSDEEFAFAVGDGAGREDSALDALDAASASSGSSPGAASSPPTSSPPPPKVPGSAPVAPAASAAADAGAASAPPLKTVPEVPAAAPRRRTALEDLFLSDSDDDA